MTGEIVARVVRALERYYQASAEDPRPFVAVHEDDGGRELLLVREGEEDLELKLVLPRRLATVPPQGWQTLTLDDRCQVVEGASHFLMVCERARADRSTTHLELELQAEVDKWLVLSNGGRLDRDADLELRDALFPIARASREGEFLHPANTVEGERYRLANNLAARFVHKLSTTFVRAGRHDDLRAELSKFFRMTQEEKLRAVAA
ncbi:MAG: hypothetical protein HYV09_30960 [Deltaproteobacteria bacterium]|nr:hypothetical protein [Deltaproteobacteria bacterium]